VPAVSVRTLLRDASTVFGSLERDGEPILITRRGRPVAALVPVDPEQADAMILSAAPAMIESRRQAETARAEGRTTPLADVLTRLDAMDTEQAAEVRDGKPVRRKLERPAAPAGDIARPIGPPPKHWEDLAYLLGARQAAVVNQRAYQCAHEITHATLAKAAEARLIEQDDQPEQFEERITELNCHLLSAMLFSTLTRDLLERVAAAKSGTAPLEDIADPTEGILGKSLAEAALGEATTFVSEVNADVIASSTRDAKLSPEIMETALSVSIGTLEKVE
jgi:antitoxin (DNA-binding transcriptional repressor) of toxin-antitoxin stability system